MTSLWEEASYDAEAEDLDRKLTGAREAASGTVPFLFAASSQGDYENRKALMTDQLDKAAGAVSLNDPVGFAIVRSKLEDSLDQDFFILAQEKVVSKAAGGTRSKTSALPSGVPLYQGKLPAGASRLMQRMNNAPDFGYDDEEVALRELLAPHGLSWAWSDDFYNPKVVVLRTDRLEVDAASKKTSAIDDSTRSFTLNPDTENWIGNFSDQAVQEMLDFWQSEEGANTQPNLPGYADGTITLINDELQRRQGVRSRVVAETKRRASLKKNAVSKTFDEWNREETKRLTDREGSDIASHVRKARRPGGMARMMFWDDYLQAAERDGFEPETKMFGSFQKRAGSGSAERALEHFLNVTQADMNGKMHDYPADCPCYPMWDVSSPFNTDPVSWQAWSQLDEFVSHITGYDDYDSWLQYNTRVGSLRKRANTCSTCGDSIERDPEGEKNRSWHHSNGESHDHEAQPSESTEASLRKRAASDYGWMVTHQVSYNEGDQDQMKSTEGQPSEFVYGPRDISEEMKAQLRAGKGQAFQLWSDDGDLDARGRFIEGDGYGDPLSDYGEGMFGSTRMTVGNNQPYIGKRASRKTGQFRADVTGIGENSWSNNAMVYDTEDEAKDWLAGLSMRWFGYDMARVVPADTPTKEPVDMNDPTIYQNFRSGSRRAASVNPFGRKTSSFRVKHDFTKSQPAVDWANSDYGRRYGPDNEGFVIDADSVEDAMAKLKSEFNLNPFYVSIEAEGSRKTATSTETLDIIMRRDPDARPQRPTDEDYDRFESWIRATYGEQALRDYRGWGNSEDIMESPDEFGTNSSKKSSVKKTALAPYPKSEYQGKPVYADPSNSTPKKQFMNLQDRGAYWSADKQSDNRDTLVKWKTRHDEIVDVSGWEWTLEKQRNTPFAMGSKRTASKHVKNGIDAEFIRTWLFTHWITETPKNRAMVECMLSNKDNWQYLDAHGEKYRNMREGNDWELDTDDMGVDHALGFALTALTEAEHAGPHKEDCPDAHPWKESSVKRTAKVSKSDAEKVLAAVKEAFAPWIDAGFSEPTLNMEWDWMGDGPSPAIYWEEGPFQWTYLFPEGGVDEEFGGSHPDVSSKIPKSVFVEPITQWAIGLYDA